MGTSKEEAMILGAMRCRDSSANIALSCCASTTGWPPMPKKLRDRGGGGGLGGMGVCCWGRNDRKMTGGRLSVKVMR